MGYLLFFLPKFQKIIMSSAYTAQIKHRTQMIAQLQQLNWTEPIRIEDNKSTVWILSSVFFSLEAKRREKK